RIMKAWQLLRIEQLGSLRMALIQLTGLTPAFPNFRSCALQHLFVVGVFPLHQLFDYFKQPLTLRRRLFLVHPTAQMAFVTGVVDHLRKNHRPRRRQRPPRPPQVQSTGVAMTDRLFTSSRDVDRIQRQSDFDEFFGGFDGICHINSGAYRRKASSAIWPKNWRVRLKKGLRARLRGVKSMEARHSKSIS